MKRHFLFLQSVCSPFFARLAARLVADGHAVHKVNFTAGDLAYWRVKGAATHAFRDSISELAGFYDELIAREGITDLVLFGDCRPVHQPAIARAKVLGVRIHVFEEGYFRPHWVTLEREGVNAHSLLPRDPQWFREVATRLQSVETPTRFASPFVWRAAHDVVYHLAGASNPVFFPRYRTHALTTAPQEYFGYVKRYLAVRGRKAADDATIARVVAAGKPYFVLPLQLDGDAQIRQHSPFKDMGEVMGRVIASFAACAPSGTDLIVKNHPLDSGLVDYGRVARRLAAEHGLADRVVYLESGDLDALLGRAAGLVTVNSTVGCIALGAGCPTMALADPIYRMPGLTFVGALDEFWTAGERPDGGLFKAFRRTVIHSCQINGGFYSSEGIALAVANSVDALVSERSKLEELLHE